VPRRNPVVSGGEAQRLLLLLTLLFLLVACGPPPQIHVDADRPALELTKVPFYPQEQYQCGPAALATVLQWTGVRATPEELAPALVIPELKGSLQIEMLAQSRAQGRVPFVIKGELRSIQAELAAGHPVIVLQNLAFAWKPVWHYAVVVGVDPATQTVTLRSGREQRHVVDWTLFERTWKRADHWAIVVLKPGVLPASADITAVMNAAMPFEQSGDAKTTLAIYRSAAKRWPDEIAPQLGVANSYYTQGKLKSADTAYRNVIAKFPDDPVAYNNLALVLADRKRWKSAEAMVEKALQIGGPLREEFLDTQRQIHCRGKCK